MKLKITLSFFSILISSLCLSGTGDKVSGWFDSMSYSNVTPSGIYKGQTARFATLGGVSTRAPITNVLEFGSVQTPSISAGCNGIDAFSGGFSIINADQFVENLRAIGQNAQALAFMLAIQVVSPQLSGVMQNIKDWQQKINNMNMSSCEAASSLAGGVLAQFSQEKANCISGRQQNYGESFSTASWSCSTGQESKNTVGSDGDKNETGFVSGNIAWYILMQDPYFSNDLEFAQLVMNITGTVIISPITSSSDAGNRWVTILPAIYSDSTSENFDNIYNALLFGKDAESALMIRTCDSLVSEKTGCVSVSSLPKSVSKSWDGLNKKVGDLLFSITSKVQLDEALTSAEKGIIASTSIPIYRYISTATTHFPNTSEYNKSISQKYERLISQDILLRALNSVINRVAKQSTMLKKGMADDPKIIKFREQLKGVRAGITKKQGSNALLANDYTKMLNQINSFEKKIFPKLGNQIQSAAFWSNR